MRRAALGWRSAPAGGTSSGHLGPRSWRAACLAVALGAAAPAAAGEGPLDGLVVYLSAGHGYVVHSRGEGWQRPVQHGLLEDTWTARFATRELIPALERAGATVLTARERDPHRERVVVDDSDPGFMASGGEATDADTRLPPGAVGGWNLAAPHGGTWQLYVRWVADDALDPGATYTVHTPSGSTTHTVDQTVHGGEWWPLARLDLDHGDWVRVDVEGRDAPVSADAVRLGGGTYTLQTSAGPRTVRAWEAAAVHHLALEGVPATVWAVPGGGLAGDASARARWADWSHPDGEEAVYLSLHTDAGGGSGTTAFVRRRCSSCDDRSVASTRLADALRGAVVDAIRAEHHPDWRDRGTRGASLAEVSDELNPELPSALLEMGFHDHEDDARWLADPTFQATLADALTRGLIRYRDPEAAEPPAQARLLSWTDERLTWATDSANTQPQASEWLVRGRVSAARWTHLATTSATEVSLPEDIDAIELIPVGPGGMGRPLRVERDEVAVAEGGS